MLPILEYDLYKYLALAVMLLAILFAYRKGRDAVSASSRSLAWTHVPLIAFAIASLGPSAFAIMIYLGYKFGLIQPKPSGYSFSTFIRDLPIDWMDGVQFSTKNNCAVIDRERIARGGRERHGRPKHTGVLRPDQRALGEMQHIRHDAPVSDRSDRSRPAHYLFARQGHHRRYRARAAGHVSIRRSSALSQKSTGR